MTFFFAYAVALASFFASSLGRFLSPREVNLTGSDIGTNLSSFEHAPNVLESPLCFACHVWAKVDQLWWAPKSYKYVHVIHVVVVTIKEGNPVTSTSSYENDSKFFLGNDLMYDSTIVDVTTGLHGIAFPTGYLLWSGYHGTRTCYPPKSDASYNGRPFSRAMLGKTANWIDPAGPMTAPHSPVPLHSWKAHFNVETCKATKIGAGSVVPGISLSYVRVTYLTKTITTTATRGEKITRPTFPTTNDVESSVNAVVTSADPSFTSGPFPTGWNFSVTTGIANDTNGARFGFDPGDWVDDHMPSIGPILSSRCSAYAASAYTHDFLATAAMAPGNTIMNMTRYHGPTWSKPCCGECWLTIPSVEVFYWPTPAVSGVSTLVSNGYTFQSPSVYVDFVTAEAGNACGHPGTYSSRVTLAFNPNELSTLYNNVGKTKHGQIERPFDFADFNTLNCPSYASTANISRTDNPFANGNPCFPTVIAPSGAAVLTSLNAEWAGCSIQAQMLDPPRALTSVGAIAPAITTASPPAVHTPPKPTAVPDTVPSKTAGPKVPASKVPLVSPLIPGLVSDPGSDLSKDPTTGSGSKGVDPGKSGSSSGSDSPKGGSDPGTDPQSRPDSSHHSGGIFNEGPNSNGESHPNAGPSDDTSPGKTGSNTESNPNKGKPYQGSGSDSQSAAASPQKVAKHSNVNIAGHGVFIPTQGVSSFAFGHQTVSVGGPAVTVGTTPVSLAPSHLVVGTVSHQLVPTAPPTRPEIAKSAHAGGFTFAIPVPSAHSLVVGSMTAKKGGPAIVVSGTPVSLGPSHLVVGTKTHKLEPTPAPASPDTESAKVGGHKVAIPGQGAKTVVIGSQTISKGQPAVTIAGTPVSLGPSHLVVGTKTHDLAVTPEATPPKAIKIAGNAIALPSLGASVLTISSQTLSAGHVITISSTPISLNPSALVIGSSSIPLPTFSPSPSLNYFALSGQTYAVGPHGLIIGSTTLTPGGSAITISGTPVSMGASRFVVGSKTETFPAAVSGNALNAAALISNLPQLGASTVPAAITIAGETIDMQASDIVIDSHTLHRGDAAVTISGTVISLGSSDLVVGTRTETWAAAAESTAVGGLGAVIMGAFGPGGASTTADDLNAPTGSAGVGTGTSTGPASQFTGVASKYCTPVSLVGTALLIAVLSIWTLAG